MSTPTASWGTHRVYGTWNNLNSTRKAGDYVAMLGTRVTNETDDVIVPLGLVASGSLNTVNMAAPSLDLLVPANDDPDNTPNGWLISLTVTFSDGAPPESYVLDTPLGGETNLREIIFPQEISGEPNGFLRGVAGGIAGLDADGDVIDADGNKVVAGGGGGIDETELQTYLDTHAQPLANTTDSTGGAGRLALTNAERSKLAGTATGATANATDSALRDRATHTGVQTSSTISDLTEAVQDIVGSFFGAGTGASVSYNDAANTITISATGTSDLEAIRDAIGVALVGVGVISIAVNDAGDTITISSTATVNSTDAALRDRSTHTGVQAQSTVTNLTTDLAAKLPVLMSRPRIKATNSNTWPVRSASIPSGYTGDVEWDHSKYGTVSTLPADIVTDDIVTDQTP